jgi:hypothetical protein
MELLRWHFIVLTTHFLEDYIDGDVAVVGTN